MIFYKWEQSAIGEIDMAVIDFKNAVMSRFKLVEGLETVSIQQANPKGFPETILAQIKLFWLKLYHPEAEIVKPLGVFDPAAE